MDINVWPFLRCKLSFSNVHFGSVDSVFPSPFQQAAAPPPSTKDQLRSWIRQSCKYLMNCCLFLADSRAFKVRRLCSFSPFSLFTHTTTKHKFSHMSNRCLLSNIEILYRLYLLYSLVHLQTWSCTQGQPELCSSVLWRPILKIHQEVKVSEINL